MKNSATEFVRFSLRLTVVLLLLVEFTSSLDLSISAKETPGRIQEENFPYPSEFSIYTSEIDEFASLLNWLCKRTGHCQQRDQDPRKHFLALQGFLDGLDSDSFDAIYSDKKLTPKDFLLGARTRLVKHISEYKQDSNTSRQELERFHESVIVFQKTVEQICENTKHCKQNCSFGDPMEHFIDLYSSLTKLNEVGQAEKLTQVKTEMLEARQRLRSRLAHSRSETLFEDSVGIQWLRRNLDTSPTSIEEVFIEQPPPQDQETRRILRNNKANTSNKI